MDTVEQRSKALFGNKDMLRLCDQIARYDDQFTAQELAKITDVVYSTTHRLLGALTAAGLVERLPRNSGEREQWYRRRRHRFWQAARDLQAGSAQPRMGGPDGDER